MDLSDLSRFKGLTYEDFRRLAQDPALSRHEKVGFPNAYRDGKEDAIFDDILSKLRNLSSERKTALEIGPGCSDVPKRLIAHCRERNHALHLIDSAEMLELLPDGEHVSKHSGRFPQDCLAILDQMAGAFDVVLAYSVLHYVFAERSLDDFLDSALGLLAEGGELLLGDIPNASKRRRFFSSPAGVRFHQQFTGTDSFPDGSQLTGEQAEIDDEIILSLMKKCRLRGFDAYALPQPKDLPMANRREDLLVRRP
jgi:cyclopropane fatty-acyl-phospholipid synthase-like methyltransferase